MVYLRIFILALFFNLGSSVRAEIVLPAILSDNMVLQKESEVKLWGWKTTWPNGEIRIICSWSRDTVRTSAQMGEWSAHIQTPASGGSHEIRIESDFESKLISNVLIGEVWLGSGQSNMEMPVDSIHWDFPGVLNFKEEVKSADFPEIRLFLVKLQKSPYPQNDLKGEWVICSPETVKEFSGVAYFFAKKLHEELSVPIGVIASSWGGTNAETWINKEVLSKHPDLMEPFEDSSNLSKWYPTAPGETYSAMIHPLQSFTIKGVIWYQGESNRNRPEAYPKVMKALISSWRAQWGIDFPFYFTQIAPFNYKYGTPSFFIKEAQSRCLNIAKTGMAITSDVGNLKHIHPQDKQTVGERLARIALKKDYGKDISHSGPVFQSMKVVKQEVVLNFDFSEGLHANVETLKLFEVAGVDEVFFPAEARIIGEQIVVSSKKVKDPAAVRFAFADTAQPKLYNEAGLPASPFRTDHWSIKP